MLGMEAARIRWSRFEYRFTVGAFVAMVVSYRSWKFLGMRWILCNILAPVCSTTSMNRERAVCVLRYIFSVRWYKFSVLYEPFRFYFACFFEDFVRCKIGSIHFYRSVGVC